MNDNFYYVYIITSIADPSKKYVGYTQDLNRRLNEHNSLNNDDYTSIGKPWQLRCFFAFEEKLMAIAFEKHLKASSGRAFVKKYFGI